MSDIRIDSRDLAIVLDALNGFLEDYDRDLFDSTRQAYERLCDIAGVDPVEELGGPADDDYPILPPEQFRPPTGEGFRTYLPDWMSRPGHHRSAPAPRRDVAKEIADRMMEATKEAAANQTSAAPARPMTEEEKARLRELLDD